MQPNLRTIRGRTLISLVLVLAGIGMVAFSAYMMAAAIEQRARITQLVEQTRILRMALAEDRDWQVKHHLLFEKLERAIQATVNRKEALIRAALKRQYKWTDADIDDAIRSESKFMDRDVPAAPAGDDSSPPSAVNGGFDPAFRFMW